jgi:radical SAM superfamily enzyme YgiQ (UPF0313 family)
MATRLARRTFRLVLIKPSHYDRDGYVIRWYRNVMPSNSLATVRALAIDTARRRVLGPEVDIDVAVVDETTTRVRIERIIADFRRGEYFGLVGIVGVQSNQYPRAIDIARPLCAAGIRVVIGGFHVSGIRAMFSEVMPDLKEALNMGASLFCGEAEGRMEVLITAAATGRLQPIYDFVDDLPNLEGAVTPFMPKSLLQRTAGEVTSFDAGRGCPFRCSFCTIINVQGRKSRSRTADDVEQIVRANSAQGVTSFFITDDNFARNKNWEAIFDRLAELREGARLKVRFLIQVDTMAHRIPHFIEKAKRAGVTRIFIGLESVNPGNLLAAKKRQNRIAEYRRMLLAWRAVGIWTFAGYIIGFPHDTPESVRRDIELVKRELPVDMLEFSILTPLPGSEDHKILFDRGVALDPDLNKYDIEQVCTKHPNMEAAEWEQAYLDAWKSYYSAEHIETILRRARATGIRTYGLLLIMLWFTGSMVPVENVHPMCGGVLRLKHPSERRPSLPRESFWRFYPRFVWETIIKLCRLGRRLWQIARIVYRVATDPKGLAYSDPAIGQFDEQGLDMPRGAKQKSDQNRESVATKPRLSPDSIAASRAVNTGYLPDRPSARTQTTNRPEIVKRRMD